MAGATLAPPSAVSRSSREGTSSWPLIDRLGYWMCWVVGIGLALIAVGIVVFMFVKGISYLHPSLLFEHPAPEAVQNKSGGFLDPIEGTLIVTVLGTLIAAPIGVALAVWLNEYGRPAWLARGLESAIEIIAGVPSVVLAIFGLLIFAQGFLAFLSERTANGAVYGRSFFAAGIIMAVLALPLIFGATREALIQLPMRTREASFALGKTRAVTTRHVLLPAIRPGIATGVVLGMGRIIGDTAVIRILAGVSLKLDPAGNVPLLGLLRGTGGTLTTYVYENSPAGEGGSPQKAYLAAFVLLVMVLALNALVTWLSLRSDPNRERRPRFSIWRVFAWTR